MAALISFYRTDKANDGDEIMQFMKTASVEEITEEEQDYWHADLTEMIPMVQEYYELIRAREWPRLMAKYWPKRIMHQYGLTENHNLGYK